MDDEGILLDDVLIYLQLGVSKGCVAGSVSFGLGLRDQRSYTIERYV